jgi:hypothetical protein
LHDLLLIEKCCTDLGLNPKFIMHVNDSVEKIFDSRFNIIKYNNYKELDDLLLQVTCVISSDSFPAHYAEYHVKKVYVVNNHMNNYYLPYSTFINKWFSVGVDIDKINEFLKQ